MWKDPIVEEVRRYREQYASGFNYDINLIFQDIRKRQAKAGKKLISFSPRAPVKIHEASKFSKLNKHDAAVQQLWDVYPFITKMNNNRKVPKPGDQADLKDFSRSSSIHPFAPVSLALAFWRI